MSKELKKIMTDLAAGHISKKEADRLIKANKTPQIKPKQEILREKKKDHARKRKLNKPGGK